ncbi:MAG: response regulator [Elusimicrobia bacterium]|nr:response regulator [Elusimicrobiota bacterium]
MKKRLLVIDDDPRFRALVLEAFSAEFEVAAASDFEEGLGACRRETPDLILVDVCIPRMGGLAIVGALANDDATRRVPVLVVSSLSLAGSARSSFSSKPNVRGIVDKVAGMAAFRAAVASAVKTLSHAR